MPPKSRRTAVTYDPQTMNQHIGQITPTKVRDRLNRAKETDSFVSSQIPYNSPSTPMDVARVAQRLALAAGKPLMVTRIQTARSLDHMYSPPSPSSPVARLRSAVSLDRAISGESVEGGFLKGGRVPRTGLYVVHKSEVVIPASRVKSVDKALKKQGMKPLRK